MEYIIFILAGVIGGMINAVAGGGGIIMYPALILSGLNPVTASATITMVIWPGSLASAYGYRKELAKVTKNYLWLTVPCFIGAVIGSRLLIDIDPADFKYIAPWLVLSAVLLLAAQSKIHRLVSIQYKKRKIRWHTMPLIYFIMFPLAIYGGFFGVGVGLMVLSVLSFAELKNMHQINGTKNLTAVIMAVVAMINFSFAGLVNYRAGFVMAVGAMIGGLTGAKLAHKVSAHRVHDITVVLGLIISLILIIQSQ